MANVVLTCLLIIVARILDVSLGTFRTIVVVQGRRGLAFVLGFCEVLIWIMVAARVISSDAQNPIYSIAYAFGFALGNYIGMTIEQRVALGRQAVRIITRRGAELASALREAGLRVTVFQGHGRDGPVEQLFVEVERRAASRIVAQARALDPMCYYIVDDIRFASSAAASRATESGWRSLLKRK